MVLYFSPRGRDFTRAAKMVKKQKEGKIMNPTDAHRKMERRKELQRVSNSYVLCVLHFITSIQLDVNRSSSGCHHMLRTRRLT